MSEEIDEAMSELSIVDQLKSKHKKQVKEFEAKCTKMRHSVPKGDKKRLKEVKEEISKLERELKDSQLKEIEEAKSSQMASSNGDQVNVDNEISTHQNNELDTKAKPSQNDEVHNGGPKLSRAQRRRDKKAAAAAEKVEKMSQEYENSAESLRMLEMSKITSKLEKMHLSVFDIDPNGDCLFSAINHQLKEKHSIESSVPALRMQVANLLRQNRTEYMPFMEEPTDESGFMAYCHKMETTHEWGGHLELMALSRVLGFPIKVVQADGPDIDLEPGVTSQANVNALIVTFHRHEFGLGEHYNSTTTTKTMANE